MMNQNRVKTFKTSANDRIQRCADPILPSQQTDSPAHFLETTPYFHGQDQGVHHQSQPRTSFNYTVHVTSKAYVLQTNVPKLQMSTAFGTTNFGVAWY